MSALKAYAPSLTFSVAVTTKQLFGNGIGNVVDTLLGTMVFTRPH